MKGCPLPTAAAILDVLLPSSTPKHGESPGEEPAEIMDLILALHYNNLEQWHREDDAREDDSDDTTVAAAKRDIDRLNSTRHGLIESIDGAILLALEPREGATLVTESPGMAIDRLSVLVIRLGATAARADSVAANAALYADRLPRLQRQLNALQEAIGTLLDDLAAGTRRYFAYESLKLYGTEGP
jgi:uncharacterized protein DUF4254